MSQSRYFLKTRKAGFLLAGLAALALMGLGFHFFVHPGPHRQWSYALGSESVVDFAPIVTNSTVYMLSDHTSDSTTLFALDRQSGSEKWSHQFSGSLDYTPRLSNGLMYAVSSEVGEASQTLHVFNRVSGNEAWSYQASGFIESFVPPNAGSNLAYVEVDDSTGGRDKNTLYALDARSGQQVWATQVGTTNPSSPVVANGLVYIAAVPSGSSSNTLYALDALSGRKQWSYREGVMTLRLAVVNGLVYTVYHTYTAAATAPSGFYRNSVVSVLDAASGSAKWSRTLDTDYALIASPLVANDIVYLEGENFLDSHNDSTEGKVYALDTSSGREIWTMQNIHGQPTVAHGLVYLFSRNAADTQDAVIAVDGRSGQKRWSYSLNSFANSALDTVPGPLLAGSLVYESTGNTIYALDALTGQKRWSYQGRGFSTEPVVADGVVYIGDGGSLDTIQPTSSLGYLP